MVIVWDTCGRRALSDVQKEHPLFSGVSDSDLGAGANEGLRGFAQCPKASKGGNREPAGALVVTGADLIRSRRWSATISMFGDPPLRWMTESAKGWADKSASDSASAEQRDARLAARVSLGVNGEAVGVCCCVRAIGDEGGSWSSGRVESIPAGSAVKHRG
jgi:hypothetical protein